MPILGKIPKTTQRGLAQACGSLRQCVSVGHTVPSQVTLLCQKQILFSAFPLLLEQQFI